jgi:tetratricopeptide (TPR) repeat protein
MGADSAAASFNYMQLSVAFIQAGFHDEAERYISKAYDYNNNSPYISWVRAGIVISGKKDYIGARAMMIADYEKDTSRMHYLQEIAKIEYGMGNYESAYRYFDKFNKVRESMHLDIFRNVDLTIAVVYDKLGKKQEAERYVKRYLEFAANDKTIYRNMHYAMYYAWKGDREKTIEHLEAFSKEDNYQLWVLLLETDQIIDKFKDDKRFQEVIKAIDTKFWKNHEKIKKELQDEGLI